jgi:hypothetical protein
MMQITIIKKWTVREKRLKGIKEQILMGLLGLGWNEVYHAWLKDRLPYTSNQLLWFFKQIVIPLAETLDVPGESPLTCHHLKRCSPLVPNPSLP